MRKAELTKERQQRSSQAIAIVERRMREASAQSATYKANGDTAGYYKMNTVWVWLDAVRRDLQEIVPRS